MSDQETTQGRAGLNKALRQGFRAAWDALGYVFAASFGAFVATALTFTAMALLASRVKPTGPVGMLYAIPGLLVAWMCGVGIFYYVYKSSRYEHPVPADMFRGIRLLAGPALALFVVDLSVTTLFVGDLAFFALAFRARGGIIMAALGMVSAYFALMWLMMSLYHLPLLISQLDAESGPRLKKILYKSYLLAADNPGFTVGLFVVIIAFAVICAAPVMLGMAVVFPGATAFLLTFALRELFTKYGLVEQEPEEVEDKPWKLGE